MLTYQSSQTNPNAANYKGSQAFRTVPMSSQTNKTAMNYQGNGAPKASSGSVLGLNTGFGGGGSTATASVTNTDTGGQSDSERDFAAEFEQALNDYYNPAFSRLDSLEQGYNQELPTAQAGVENSFADAINTVNNNFAQSEAGIQAQSRDVDSGKKSAISQARQLYNELSQRGLSRFGAGTSAGGAYSEIIGRQTAQNMGSAEQTAADANVKLDNELRNLTNFVTTQKTNLGEKKKTALAQLKNDFDAKIRDINAQRGQLESDKAAQRIAELQNARQRAYEIETADKAFQRQIDLFNEEKKSALASQYSVNGGISTQAINAFKSLAPVIGTVAAAKMAGLDLSTVQGMIRPQATQWKSMGDGRWINTETGEMSIDPNSDASLAQGVTG